jgi:uncharacterized protein YbjT (DUF2867 family)
MVKKTVLIMGATGYVGKRLVAHLCGRGFRVRAAGRSRRRLAQLLDWLAWEGVDIAQADVFDADSLRRACEGCCCAFYLVHSMNPRQRDFMHADRKAAGNMARAAESAGLERIIYLGGLGDEGPDLSRHLRSRAEVGEVLGSGRVPLTFLRAAMIIGSGSASFEILHHLVDRLPVMITPRWVRTESQPIAISNVLRYLRGCLERPETIGGTFDIGGPEIVTYRRLMEIYAEEAGLLRRLVLPVPVLTPRLSAYWIHLVTPVPAALARPLAEGLKNRAVCRNDEIRRLIPQDLLSCREAIRRALRRCGRFGDLPAGEFPVLPPPESSYPGDHRWSEGIR